MSTNSLPGVEWSKVALKDGPSRRRLGPPSPASMLRADAAADRALPVSRDGGPNEHALATWWTFWGRGHMPSKDKSWESERLHEIETVEAWWRLNGALQLPSTLSAGTDYQLFRRGVKPTWEDPANATGGKWTLCPARKSHPLLVDECWQALVLAALGDAFCREGDADYDEITGVSLASRRGGVYKVSLWTKTRDEALQKRIGAKIRSLVDLPESSKLWFAAHDSPDTLYEA